MTAIEVAAIIVSLAALLGYANARLLKLPSAIGLMAMALLGSFVIIALDHFGFRVADDIEAWVTRVDFANVLMHGMLGLLLFAGALHVDLTDLKNFRVPIGALALGGTFLSTILVGGATHLLTTAIGHPIGFGYALLFGALISPTDPIAVLGILKSANAPKELEVKISGESLFNDGVGVVLFIAISRAVTGGDISVGEVGALFAREALGGAVYGLALGYIGFRLLRTIDDYSVEVLITVAIVVGGYALAERLHISAPIAAVVAGLMIGNQGRRLAMSDVTRKYVDMFWKLIDEILNAVLFLLLGLEATRLQFSLGLLLLACAVIPVVLGARFVSVAVPVTILRRRRTFAPHAIKILTWGGLRGGISVALALSIPEDPARTPIVVLTYAVVTFSVLFQGLTLGRFLRRLESRGASDAQAPAPVA